MLDAHLHLTRLPDALNIARCLKSVPGYSAVSSACAPWEWTELEKLLECNSKNLFPAFGIHPEEASHFSEDEESHLQSLLEKYPRADVGECGLDKRFPGYGKGEVQERVFKRQIALSIKYKRPIVIHCVGDYRRIISILHESEFPFFEIPVIFHRFGGDLEILSLIKQIQGIISIHEGALQKKITQEALFLSTDFSFCFETDADRAFLETHFENLEKISPMKIALKLNEILTRTRERFLTMKK